LCFYGVLLSGFEDPLNKRRGKTTDIKVIVLVINALFDSGFSSHGFFILMGSFIK
jgi:hypothetical protein